MTTFTLREEYGDRYESLDEAIRAAAPFLAELIWGSFDLPGFSVPQAEGNGAEDVEKLGESRAKGEEHEKVD